MWESTGMAGYGFVRFPYADGVTNELEICWYCKFSDLRSWLCWLWTEEGEDCTTGWANWFSNLTDGLLVSGQVPYKSCNNFPSLFSSNFLRPLKGFFCLYPCKYSEKVKEKKVRKIWRRTNNKTRRFCKCKGSFCFRVSANDVLNFMSIFC